MLKVSTWFPSGCEFLSPVQRKRALKIVNSKGISGAFSKEVAQECLVELENIGLSGRIVIGYKKLPFPGCHHWIEWLEVSGQPLVDKGVESAYVPVFVIHK